MPLVSLGVQATEHQTQAVEERKGTPAVGDHERGVAAEIQNGFNKSWKD